MKDEERIKKEIIGDKGVLVLVQKSDNVECLICSKIESSVRRYKTGIKN